VHCSRSEPESSRIWWAEVQVASHNEPGLRNLKQFKSWTNFQVFLFLKSDFSLPAKEVKPHSSGNTFSHLCCSGFQRLLGSISSRTSCWGEMVDFLQLVSFNFHTASVLCIVSPHLLCF
jgi:hypothetical protein